MTEVSKDGATIGPIVVGVDGSEASKAALRWAASQAQLTGAPLRVLSTWETSYAIDRSGAQSKVADAEGMARAILEKTVDEVLGTDTRGGDFTLAVVHGHAAPILVEESQHASLVVVGSRGHGEFAGMLLGSVSQHVSGHAQCPVAIIHS